ncbi:hypothetical protein C8F04DRAFT_1061495 [Mycena alexandri]|uniref:Uncharacterized protein n=1 Tax=Mycena alexandri TaxID=1745969 RepID=A0AAD6XG19_9AGAR|nr:hypothetical protein C8F04DRAFT_1061495 [Mycena alexandri]
MKSFFQRRPDTQPPPRSYTPANNDPYKVWLPPPDASRGPTARPSTWVPAAAQANATRNGGETQRSSSRAGRVDASSAQATSSAYKYATLPNTTGFYYPNNQPQPAPPQPFPSQYYPQRPPPGGFDRPDFDRPDSRAGNVPYPYPNPQYPQTLGGPPPPQPAVWKDKTRNTGDSRTVPVPAPASARPSSSKKHSERDAPRKQPSSSSIKEQKLELEMKRPKHRTRESSETRKKRDSHVEDPYTEKQRERSSRKEPRRDARSRPDIRVEEGDSSDSSIRRPSSVAGHRREGRPPSMMNKPQQDATPFPRTGFPGQPTAASSSSGKQTPQISRMPVYLPASHGRAQRQDDQPGQSESDTDHGALNRGRNFLRGTAVKQPSKPANLAGPPSTLNLMNKKLRESKGLWPFSRSKSQKPPESKPAVASGSAKYPTTKLRADSTPARFPEPASTGATQRPEYRRHASDNSIRQTAAVPQPEVQPPASRALFFASQPTESSRLVTTASQQAALHSLASRTPINEVPPAPKPVQAPERPPMTTTTSSSSRQNPIPQTGMLPGQPPGFASGPNLIPRSETPLRRDGRDTSNLPPIYAPPVVSRASDYARAQDRSTPPKVSQLVAGFEARSSETQAHLQPQTAPSGARREVREKPSLSRIYAPPQQSAGPSAPPPPAVNPYFAATQPPPPPRLPSDKTSRPLVESSSAQSRSGSNPPDALKTQLRDLLTDKPAPSRAEERSQSRKAESRNNPAAPPTLYPNSRPPDWTSQSFSQPPVQVYSAGTSSVPFKATSKSEKPVEVPPVASTFSRRPDVQQFDSAERTSRTGGGTSRGGDEVGRSSRSKREKDPIAVMKTPSKDSSRHTSSPAPVPLTHPTNQSRSNETSSRSNDHRSNDHPSRSNDHVSRSNDKSSPPRIGASQPSTSRPQNPMSAEAGKHARPSVPSGAPLSSFAAGDRSTSHPSVPSGAPLSSFAAGDRSTSHRATRPDLLDPPITTFNASTSSLPRGERPRPAPSTSAAPVSSTQPLPVQSNLAPSSRTAAPAYGAAPLADPHPSSHVPSSNRALQPLPVQSNLPPSGRAAAPAHGSAPLADIHSTAYVASSSRRSRRVPSEESILKTPSSLAHSVLPPSALQPTVSRTSIPASVSSQMRKNGLFGMFRSKGDQHPESHSFDSHRHVAPDRGHNSSSESEANPTRSARKASKSNVPPPITVPNPALPISDRKSPNSRVFTPFRYLTSKRNRRMSTASMDANDGTAPNTVMGSPTASMQSSQIPPQSPPKRDPQIATQDWRNQEESDIAARGQKRGKQRRMRPGVVFDVAEDPLEETKRSRPGRLKKSQNAPLEPGPSGVEPPKEPPTDSSDG